MVLPTEHEIDPYAGLPGNGQAAVHNFLGKSRAQITAEFRARGMEYQEDLMWMGASAFCFYFPAALAYLASSESRGDSDVVSSLCMVIEFRLQDDGEKIHSAFPAILEFVDHLAANYEQYDLPAEFYGELRPRLNAIRQKLSRAGNS